MENEPQPEETIIEQLDRIIETTKAINRDLQQHIAWLRNQSTQ